MDSPTFSPSLLVRSMRYPELDPDTKDYKRGPDGQYLLGIDGRLDGVKDTVCHSFVTDGKIQFLGDCTHELANKTVPLEDA